MALRTLQLVHAMTCARAVYMARQTGHVQCAHNMPRAEFELWQRHEVPLGVLASTREEIVTVSVFHRGTSACKCQALIPVKHARPPGDSPQRPILLLRVPQ